MLISESKGKWLYVANQGRQQHDPSNAQSGIAGIRHRPRYQLTPLPMAVATAGTGAGPQCMVEDPSNQFIYTANFNDSTVTGQIDRPERRRSEPSCRVSQPQLIR